jgi:hypothetical protein
MPDGGTLAFASWHCGQGHNTNAIQLSLAQDHNIAAALAAHGPAKPLRALRLGKLKKPQRINSQYNRCRHHPASPATYAATQAGEDNHSLGPFPQPQKCWPPINA